MKILILGGYGMFGGRLCQLLASDQRLSLYIAGRSLEKASEFCRTLPLGAERIPILLNRDQDALRNTLQKIKLDLLIDATGPFQVYGNDPYRLVKACIAHSVNYMDFADGSDFVKGISQFDEEAKEHGLYVLSGVSSFPVLTAAVVRCLSTDMVELSHIRGGIAPSPFAKVGMNVIRAIAAYSGKKLPLKRHGHASFGYAMTETMRYTICPPGYLPLRSTRFSLVDVPDLQVLPELFPSIDSIWMGAGPTPEILHRMLNAFAWLVRWRIITSLSLLAPLFYHAINHLRWGKHRGGMFVEVSGTKHDGEKCTRSWHMIAEGEDGPFIPCMALEALIHRNLENAKPPAGARPASLDLELSDYENLFSVRNIVTGQRESIPIESKQRLFPRLLGEAWHSLPVQLRSLHDSVMEFQASGRATVERGKGWCASLLAMIFGFPLENQDVPVNFSASAVKTTEKWVRSFGNRKFSSELTIGTGNFDKLLCERFGPFKFGVALVVNEGRLFYVVREWNIFNIPLPAAWAPGGNSYEFQEDGKFHFNVEITQPFIGIIVKYRGWLELQNI
jgi:hypothetical protein